MKAGDTGASVLAAAGVERAPVFPKYGIVERYVEIRFEHGLKSPEHDVATMGVGVDEPHQRGIAR
jgi:hypothetical protein